MCGGCIYISQYSGILLFRVVWEQGFPFRAEFYDFKICFNLNWNKNKKVHIFTWNKISSFPPQKKIIFDRSKHFILDYDSYTIFSNMKIKEIVKWKIKTSENIETESFHLIETFFFFSKIFPKWIFIDIDTFPWEVLVWWNVIFLMENCSTRKFSTSSVIVVHLYCRSS